ncbi:TetR family transcriptional regulator C-terminal domain-containing protein, partial [Actinomadura geliboluensis]|uniref:TetR family transcriptional regulator C-terminal domain-containing protein n=1 Tax=Actinomadura geliboluensis TaxID=882440 RepID=UPI003B969539
PTTYRSAGCLTISAATNVTPQDAEMETYLRNLRNTNLKRFEARLQQAQSDGELPATANPKALAHYFAAVIQGMSQQARDGATHKTLTDIATQAMHTWPSPTRPDVCTSPSNT